MSGTTTKTDTHAGPTPTRGANQGKIGKMGSSFSGVSKGTGGNGNSHVHAVELYVMATVVSSLIH